MICMCEKSGAPIRSTRQFNGLCNRCTVQLNGQCPYLMHLLHRVVQQAINDLLMCTCVHLLLIYLLTRLHNGLCKRWTDHSVDPCTA